MDHFTSGSWVSRSCNNPPPTYGRSGMAVARPTERPELFEAPPPGIRGLAFLADPLAERVADKACPTLQASSLLGSNVDLVLALDGLQAGVRRHGSAASIV